MTSVLAVDAGTSAVKVALVVDGAVVAAVSEEYPLSVPYPGWAEQDPDDWWSATERAARRLGAEVALDAVHAVAVTGQMQDLVCLDVDGRPVRPAILYSDVRAETEHAALLAELGAPWEAAIGARPDPSHVAAKWRWLQEHEPESVARTGRVLFGAAGAVVYRLCGLARCDPSTAATTGCYDVESRRWWAPVVDTLGIPVPDLVEVTEVAGALTVTAAAALGVAAGTPVVHANGDAAATTVGVCGTDLDRPYAYLGTSGWVAASTSAPRRAPGVIVLPGLGARHWMAAAQMATAGAALDWAREQLLGGVTTDDLDDMAARTCAAAEGVLFLPHLDGVRGASGTTGVLVGMRRSTDRVTIAAAVVEGLAHAVRQLVAIVAPGAGELLVCGGASRSPALRQAIADATACAVVPVAAEHASILGATTAAHAALGVDPSTSPVDGAPVAPDPARRLAHQRVASTFDALLPTMSPLLASLAGARGVPDT